MSAEGQAATTSKTWFALAHFVIALLAAWQGIWLLAAAMAASALGSAVEAVEGRTNKVGLRGIVYVCHILFIVLFLLLILKLAAA